MKSYVRTILPCIIACAFLAQAQTTNGYVTKITLDVTQSSQAATILWYSNLTSQKVISDPLNIPYRKDNSYSGNSGNIGVSPLTSGPAFLKLQALASAFAQNRQFSYNTSTSEVTVSVPNQPSNYFKGKEISIGADKTVYVIGMDSRMYHWSWASSTWIVQNDNANTSPGKVAAGPDGNPWITTNNNHTIYRWDGTAWILQSAQDVNSEITISSTGCLYVTYANGSVKEGWWLNGAMEKGWKPYLSAAGYTKAAAEPDSSVWLIDNQTRIWRYQKNVLNPFTGNATDIAISANGSIVVCGTDKKAYYWDKVNSKWVSYPTSGSIGANVKKVAVEPDGTPWYIDNTSNGNIYRWDGRRWNQM